MVKKFIRKDSFRLLRLGRLRKKARKWRRAKGGDSKVRKKRRGYARAPVIGYRGQAATRGLVAGLKPRIVYSVDELKQIRPDEIAFVGRVGRKRKIEIAKAALELKMRLANLNVKKFLEKVERERKEMKREKVEEVKKEKKPEEKETETLNKEEKKEEINEKAI